MTLALPALWKGIFYDSSALDALDSLTAQWDRAQVIQMQRAAAMDGIRAKGSTWSIHSLAAGLLELSEQGLVRLGQEEEQFLGPLKEIVESRTTRADRLIASYQMQVLAGMRRVCRVCFSLESISFCDGDTRGPVSTNPEFRRRRFPRRIHPMSLLTLMYRMIRSRTERLRSSALEPSAFLVSK